jgi:PadR family transcriptional regulator, regulatory protein AphA
MNIQIQKTDGITYLEGIPGYLLISEERDAVDLVGLCGEHETSRLMLHADNVTERFFDLKTQLAGLVLQKFVNYSVKSVLVLPPDAQQHGRFHEMAREANKGRHFGVFYDRTQAEQWLINP